jgi:dTDP-4-dehydrorhamnose reductase
LSKKKILVLGSTGLIGHQIYNYLKILEKYDLYNFSYRKKLQDDSFLIDARNEKQFFDKIYKISPDIIINCIGILINGANTDPENAIFLNAYLPHKLRKFSDKVGAKLIHISTDCVFSGKKATPYLEDDYKDGIDIYSKTKSLGEIIYENHLTLRTSVVGPELKVNGEELFHWFMYQSKSIKGYTKSIWSGVTTLELAKAVNCAIEKNILGLHHVTNNQSINKYELLMLFKKYTQKDINIIKIDGKETNKSFIDTRKLLDFQIPSYDIMIFEMVELIRNNKSLYSQYEIK